MVPDLILGTRSGIASFGLVKYASRVQIDAQITRTGRLKTPFRAGTARDDPRKGLPVLPGVSADADDDV